ncbi:MAG: alginate export family protein [Sulfuricurvum sp.]|uniref:alginate export family protein n=1 Tax=Sulfuricurvum sp. TaxID=2025608 RepID=UPI003562C99F
MKYMTLSAVSALALAGGSNAPLQADEGFSLFNDAKFSAQIRPRYENVDDDSNTKKDANAMSVRASIGLETALFSLKGLTMKVEGTTVQTLGAERYNDKSPDAHTAYDVVADPEQTRFTQAYLQYKYGATTAKIGRQIINLDNQRFIGSVDWRQMPQSFDALTLNNTSIAGLNLTGAYIYSYATVFDEHTWDSKSLILNGSYKISDLVKVTVYDYMISSEKSAYGSDTFGLAFSGNIPVSAAKVDYRAEYAKQGDATFKTVGVDENKNDAYYYNLDAMANLNGLLFGAGYEFLSGKGSADETAFQTPLATLHKFNGWADKFLSTPLGGLCDTSVSLGYTAPGLGKVLAVYHSFETDVDMSGKNDLGSEWDFMYTNTIPGIKGLNGLIKAAYYDGGNVSGYNADVTKFWLQFDYKF